MPSNSNCEHLCGKIIEVRKSSSFRTMLVACFSAAGVDFAIGCRYYALITNLLAGKGDKCKSNLLFDLSDFCAGGYPADGLSSFF